MKLRLVEPWLNAESPLSLAFQFDGLKLRFDEPWLNAESPIKLEFDGKPPFLGITLRFDEAWGDFRSPIKLRFEGEVPPKPPIDDGSLGIQMTVAWDDGLPVEILTELKSQFQREGIEVSLDWLSKIASENQTTLKWYCEPLVNSGHRLSWYTPVATEDTLHLWWDSPELHQINTVVEWGVVGTHETVVNTPWQITATHGVCIELGFNTPGVYEQRLFTRYEQVVGITNDISVKWGTPPARWICSTKYRPPAVGKFSMRFDDQWGDLISPITLRFTASDEYCEYYPGGGTINPNPDLPNLDFKTPIEPQIRRVYLMEPTLTCTRVSDGLAIIIISVSIGDNRSQYTQAVDIEFSSKIDADRAANELLLITINGYQFYAIAEQPTRRELFGSATYSSGGRSRTGLLSDPWRLPISYTNNSARSFAGILSDLLLNTGWSAELDGVTDFTVPAGAFSIFGKSPIDAVNDTVRQLGCMLIPDEVTSKLKVVPRWPVAPWLMSSTVADVNIHDAVIIDYNSQKQINKLCNSVWMRGEQQGISAQVKRSGTAGDKPTSDVSAALIVDVQAARTAGTSKLIDTGNKEVITVNLPIMNDLPPLTKGMLIGVTYRTEVFKTTCDSVRITASVDDTGGVQVNQSVTLIKHLEY